MSEAYAQAGVNIAAGNEAVQRMKRHVARTMRPEVLGGLGGFGGMFALQAQHMQQPVLVAGADGVGTKLKLAIAQNKHDTIGIDCVAMCVNDVLVQGAEPLFFLDYLAVGALDPQQVEAIVAGVAEGCTRAGCALLGGETAEMPGMYADGEYDLAGFAVGIVDRTKIVDGSRIQAGDVIIGLASSGLHSNGFSLVRQRLHQEGRTGDDVWEGQYSGERMHTWGDVLLTPTRIYVPAILALLKQAPDIVRGMAHITGGGLLENIPRIVPASLQAHIQRGSWTMPPVFSWLQTWTDLSHDDLYRTFNMGIGYVVIVAAEHQHTALAILRAHGEEATVIGDIRTGAHGVVFEEHSACSDNV
jgi:phosphoribosylformylglycinamidine cyclo-ligase